MGQQLEGRGKTRKARREWSSILFASTFASPKQPQNIDKAFFAVENLQHFPHFPP
jgi:hypothetical protein